MLNWRRTTVPSPYFVRRRRAWPCPPKPVEHRRLTRGCVQGAWRRLEPLNRGLYLPMLRVEPEGTMTEGSDEGYHRVDQPYLWGVPSALAIGAFLVVLCLVFLDRSQLDIGWACRSRPRRHSGGHICPRARGSVEVTSRVYIATSRNGEASRFDLASISDMQWQFIPPVPFSRSSMPGLD
jgi:hypothetical protein